MAVAKRFRPEPVSTRTVCSICGLAWEDHSESPDVLECVELLKAAAREPQPIVYPMWQSRSREVPLREMISPFKFTVGRVTLSEGGGA